ncbi:MAG: ATP-grasp domain-containing protein, partial [Candidatus Kapaibacterium sp.]
AIEVDVDVVCDGTDVYVGGVMEHIEEAGIHSGDSSCVLPPYNMDEEQYATMIAYTKAMARKLGVVGLMNVQYALQHGKIYVIEANPRASRTVPFVAKATGVPLVEIAMRVMLGEKLKDMEVRDYDLTSDRVAIKEPVFPFTKFPKVNIFLGPEMRSTGEVMGMDSSFGSAIMKSHISAGNSLPLNGSVFISLQPRDKTARAVEIARGYTDLGFTIVATRGTATYLQENGVPAETVLKHYEGRPSIVDNIKNGDIQLLINTPLGENARYDEYVMGHTAMRYKIPFFTTLAAADASLEGIRALRTQKRVVRSLQEYYAGTNERGTT